jgi:dihydroorotase
MSPANRQRIVILQGRLIDPAQNLDLVSDLYIADGRILAIGQVPVGFRADEIIDARGALVIPGAVDLCAHLREPGNDAKGTIASETRAAAAGGITHIVCPPDTDPVIDSAAVAKLVRERAQQAGHCHVMPLGALTRGLQGQHMAEMHTLREAGCVGFTQMRQPLKDSRVLLRCLEYAATFDLRVFFQSEDAGLAADGCVHAGTYAARQGLPGIPAAAETVALSRDLLLVAQTGVKAHFGQISCAGSVELIAFAQAKGLPVTADVAVHQLFLTEERIGAFDGLYHVDPPLRTEEDRKALVEGVRSGVISVLCSDHQPHEAAAKAAPFPATEPGMSTFATFLPLGYRLVREGVISVADWVRMITHTPAGLIGETVGLRVGEAACVTVFDPEAHWTLTADNILSTGANSPWLNTPLTGRVLATLKDGVVSARHSR